MMYMQQQPLSFHQERLWFIDRFETNNVYESHPAYHNIPLVLRLFGEVDIGALESALRHVIQRHASLQTRVVGQDDERIIGTHDPDDFELRIVDTERTNGLSDWRAWVESEALKPFSFHGDWLIRAALRHEGSGEAVLVITVHHFIIDRPSLQVLVDEMSCAYESFTEGREPELPEVLLQYPAFSQWQKTLPRNAFEPLLFYWRWALRGRLQALKLPEDRPRPAIHTYTPARIEFSLDKSLTRHTLLSCRHMEVPPVVWVLAAYKALLYRYSQLKEVVVGTTFHNRIQPGTESSIGPYSNLGVLRTPFGDGMTFQQLVDVVHRQYQRAADHQEMPFDLLVNELHPEKDMSRTALFDVLYQYEKEAKPPVNLNGVHAERYELNLGDGKYDFNLMIRETAQGLKGILTFNLDIYDADTAQRMTDHLQTVLERMADDLSVRVDELDLLNEKERHDEWVEWNRTGADYPTEATIHRLFEEQAATTPQAVAVTDGKRDVTYLQLETEANRLAHVLREMGVRKEALTAVCLGRGVEAVVALLAVLKAGGTYLPLNPDFPEERLRYMIEDSGTVFLVSDTESVRRIPVSVEKTLLIDRDRVRIESQPETPPSIECRSDSLMYCLYTSGSTGNPKGVLIEHRNVVRLLKNAALPFDFGAEDVWTVFHSYTFDFSVWELYGALLYGGKAVMVSNETAQDPQAFLKLLQEHGVTVLNQTPSAFYALMEAARQASFPPLTVGTVIFGGEALNPRRLVDWRKAYPHCRLVNMYGITETTVHVTIKELSERDLEESTSVIGVPIPTTTVYVLDAFRRPVPVGFPGEMYVGGLGVGRGYLHRDELSREKFVEHPCLPGERLYRSGDLAKRRANGELVYLGRIDHQVQIRGFRVELGEIQARLLEYPGIREAEVTSHEDETGSVALAAYSVCGPEISLNSLRAHLREKLPDYMVPSYFVMLPRMPLTVNGKIDHRALPNPAESRIGSETPYMPPRNSTEKRLTEIWAKTLELERVGIQDNFFDLGGHSIMATQLMSRIRRAFGIELPLRRIFEAPTVAELSGFLAESVSASGRDSETVIPRVPRQQPIPLSYPQQRLWILHQLEGPSRTYNVCTALTLKGRLDEGAFERAFAAVLARHEALRTTVQVVDGKPVQRILDEIGTPLRRMRIADSDPGIRESKIEKAIFRETRSVFHLENEPFVRALLIQTGRDEHVFVLTLHHLITDGWTQSILVRDWAQAYEAFLQGREPSWVEPVIQYADFAVWQRQRIESETVRNQLDFWKHRMQGAPSLLELPTDRQRPPVQRFTGKIKPVRFSRVLSERLKQFSRERQVTLFMTLHAAFAALMARYSGQTDVVLGTGVANRTLPELEGLAGFFVNTLLLRLDLSGKPSFLQLLRRAQQADLDAFEHQDVPFELLVDALEPERAMSHTPLFQVMFTLQNTPDAKAVLPDLSVSPRWIDPGVAKFDITVLLDERDDRIGGVIEFSDDLFDDSTIDRMMQQYELLLGSLMEQSERSVFEAEMLSKSERAALLQWGSCFRCYPSEANVVSVFAKTAEMHAEDVALEYGDRAMNYAEVDRRSNWIALTLNERGVKRGDAVGLWTGDSIHTPIAMLGILKAGAVYVPLDPEYPEERLLFTIHDSRIRVVITDSGDDVLDCESVSWLILQEADEAYEAGVSHSPGVAVAPDDPAYIIYTSGSTGMPKGVVVPHRGITRLVLNTDYCPLDPGDRIAQASNVTFDAATFEIWGALLSGAALVGIERDAALAPHRFDQTLREKRITTLFLTTALFNETARQCPAAFAHLRHVLFGGEAVDPHWVRRVLQEGAPDRLVHVYGPTENTTFSTWHLVREVADDAGTVPIGRPVAHSSAYVLDEAMQLVPIGVPGELYVGGNGLAIEYLNQPELTEQCFVRNPFDVDRAGRLYRTGDRVRRRQDGAIEFIGRRDHQVKIRGFRIELEEISSHLTQHTALRDALTVYRDGKLTAYVIPEEDSLTVDAVRSYLKSKLPDYMVPAYFVFLQAFPLNANGKIDRHALPEPSIERSEAIPVEPQTHTQKKLAAIWRDVLSIEGFGIHDPFFHLGGHSLTATQVISRIREEFGVELPLRCLFQSPTVAGLAEWIEAEQSGDETDLNPISRIERSGKYALSFAQERLWFLDKIEPDNPFYNVSIALNLCGELNVQALRNALNDILQRHEILRVCFFEENGIPYQSIQPELTLDLTVTSLASIEEDRRKAEINRLCIEEARRPFDLSCGGMVRAGLLRVDERHHVLLFTMHHIVSDGWSLGVLIDELVPLYQARCEQTAAPEAALPIQYIDFAAWQREQLSGPLLDEQCAYWKQKLAGASPVLQLPTDRPRPPAQLFRGGSVVFTVEKETVQRLHALSERNGATLYMTLLAAYAVLLYRYSGQEDIVIGSPIANRTRREIESLIGFFVNTLAMRITFNEADTFETLLRAVRTTALEAFSHQDLPFEKLVDELQLERDLSVNPLFQVMFAMQNAPIRDLQIPGLEISMVQTQRVSALFDLVMDVWETGETITGVLEYNSDLFEESTAVRMANHYTAILERIAKTAEERIDRIPLLSKQEETQWVQDWAGPVRSYPVDQPIHCLFESQAATAPDRTAAVHNGESITYKRLNRMANRLAHRLRKSGVGRNDFVGILVPRGIHCLTAMLGILKAGGAFIPIDPAYPEERVHFMIQDSRIRILIVSAETREHAGDLPHVILIDDVDTWSESDADPVPVSSARDFAYMLYTSGSTGQPKGAIVRHDGAVNHVFAEFELLGFDRDAAFLQSAPSSSDISVWQFLAPGLIGARTVIADYETVCDPQRLFETIRSERITLIELVPVVMKELLEYIKRLPPSERALPDLKTAMATGESVPVSLINQWLEHYPHVPIVNAYGPTEAADDVCQYSIRQPLPETTRSVPIGYPLPNLKLYVLDRHLQPVPIGVAGEICVAGIGVGAGYFNQPKKTQEAFVPNPYTENEYDSVLYRTGDLGYWRADGVLECLERLDFQVKIRGFRIELGEIEGVLSRHPCVREAAVHVHGEEEEKHITAYVTPNLDEPETQHHLGEIKEQQVTLWQTLHEDSYAETLTYGDETFNVIGWDSNYTHQPLPEADMREYVDWTLHRILSLQPKRLLEIGCGTGLIMFPLLPHVEWYFGMDASQVAIDQLRALQNRADLQARVAGLESAELACRLADDFSGMEEAALDTVIFPSVVQYFPGVDYLQAVLEGWIKRIQPGGAVFFGDVRSLPLLRSFHASVQFYKAEEEMSVDELAEQLNRQLESEQEMAVDPQFFYAFAQAHPAISHVETLPKRGKQINEMTAFRYDVILHIQKPIETKPVTEWVDWNAKAHGIEKLRRRLSSESFEEWALRGITNRRVERENRLLERLDYRSYKATVAQLREEIDASPLTGIDPDELIDLADEYGYGVDLSVVHSGGVGTFNAVLSRKAHPGVRKPVFVDAVSSKPWREYVNNPLQEKLYRRLSGVLRDYTQDKLPNYMSPALYVFLDAMPLTPAGKIDRRALQEPAAGMNTENKVYTAPVTEEEKQLCAVWADVLGIERVGLNDSFFALGGHSLKAAQVVSRVQREMKMDISLRDLFNHPTPAELFEIVQTRKAQLHPTAAVESFRLKSIPKAPQAKDYPLSHGQRRLFVLSQMEGASAAYNMPAALVLEGETDLGALAPAYDRLLQRHEVLRTAFRLIDGEPRQIVLEEYENRLIRMDLSQEANPEETARRLAYEDARHPFDFDAGCLIRACLLRLSHNRHVLLFNMHHIISDDISMNVLAREFVQSVETTAPPAPLPVQYKDFTVWQNRFLESEEGSAQRAYWHSVLSGELPVLHLPYDFPRPPVKTYQGASESFNVNPNTAKAVERICREESCSLFMFVCAVVNVLLHRYSGQDDLITGYPVSGRTHFDLDDQIGFYVNTLPLRLRVKSGMRFRQLLQQTGHAVGDALAHQNYPFDLLVDELSVRRDVSRSPMFDVVIVMQEGGSDPLSLRGLRIQPLVQDYPVAKFDLAFNVQSSKQGLRGDIVYNTDLFLPETVQHLCTRFTRLLDAVTTDPASPIGQLDWLTQEERADFLERCRPRVIDAPLPYASLVQWFETQVQATPDAVALKSLGAQDEHPTVERTYAKLNTLADTLAGVLQAHGVGRNVFVGIYLERNEMLIAAILAVLKAGGAYVPLDVFYPRERIAFTVEDANIQVILTQAALHDALPDTQAVRIHVDEVFHNNTHQEVLPVRVLNQPDDLAYVIYTSGTTGKPKGVKVTHRNVMRLFTRTQRWFEFSSRDVWSYFHSCAFDFSVWEMWGALLYGGRIIIVPYWLSRSPEDFYRLVCDEKVTILNQTPSAFRQFMQADASIGASNALSLRKVIFGGEALDFSMLKPWFERHGDQTPQLINMFGITETTVHVTYRPVTKADADIARSAIGEPIDDLYLMILDAQGEPCPLGVFGELYVGGAGVAGGYLNRDELTAERFVSNPLTQTPEDRVYRTGDVARRLPDGDIEYGGRIDQQVQLRGFRVEPGEIAAALNDHEAIRETVILVDHDAHGDRLIAYCIPVGESLPEPDRLRAFLRRCLPEYMIPSFFIAIEQIPLTDNGKLDQAALPKPAQERPELSGGYTAPRNALEQTVARVFQELLHIESVGVRDNFFDLGANSLNLVQAGAMLREQLQKEISVVHLFQYPSVESLSGFLEEPNAPAETRHTAQVRSEKRVKAQQRRRSKRSI